jgi:hypothetical protein
MTMTDENMRQAVWSVYVKARGLKRSLFPDGTAPVRLENALDRLFAHRDRHGGARRRRAVLEAGAAKLHQDADHHVRDRVRKLAGEMNVEPKTLTDVGTPAAPAAAVDAINHLAANGVTSAAVKTDDLRVVYDPRTHDSTLTVQTLVDVPLADMPPLIDPRRWSRCSDFFDKSDPIDPFTRASVAVSNPSQTFQIHEVFSVPNATFENILNVSLAVQTGKVRVDYSLWDAIGFTLVGFDIGGVLERDDGWIEAVPAPGDPRKTHMTTVKTIRFRDLTPEYPVEGGIDHGQWLNYCAPAMLGLWIDEASQGRLACKD